MKENQKLAFKIIFMSVIVLSCADNNVRPINYSNETFKNNEIELSKLIPSFKSRGMDLNLSRIKNTILKMGNPCKRIPAIQIIGTNGKGSIACFLESCLIKAGIKVGCTTSPHLVSWCERIRINGKTISIKDLNFYHLP